MEPKQAKIVQNEKQTDGKLTQKDSKSAKTKQN